MSYGCKSGLQKKPAAASPSHTASRPLQRAATKEECQCEECKRARLQRSATQARTNEEAPPIVYEVLRSAGQPLEASTRSFMEERLGHDFSRVRIHTDARAAESASAVSARAYAVGEDIVWGRGAGVAPTQPSFLLAHELAHVMQQSGSAPQLHLSIGSQADSLEVEADRAASKALSGSTDQSSIGVRSTPAQSVRQIQRAVEPDDGRCLPGVLTPMYVGTVAHKVIQAGARARGDIDTEVTIPKKTGRGTRADLVSVWRDDEAQARGLSFTANPKNRTPYALAEIGEIKPQSYGPVGRKYAAAVAEVQDYIAEWNRFSPIPAIPMRSLSKVGPLPFLMGRQITCENAGDGVYIYRCSGGPEAEGQRVPVPLPIPEYAYERPKKPNATTQKSEPLGAAFDPPTALIVRQVLLQIELLKTVSAKTEAAMRFCMDHPVEALKIALLASAAVVLAAVALSTAPGFAAAAAILLLAARRPAGGQPDQSAPVTLGGMA